MLGGTAFVALALALFAAVFVAVSALAGVDRVIRVRRARFLEMAGRDGFAPDIVYSGLWRGLAVDRGRRKVALMRGGTAEVHALSDIKTLTREEWIAPQVHGRRPRLVLHVAGEGDARRFAVNLPDSRWYDAFLAALETPGAPAPEVPHEAGLRDILRIGAIMSAIVVLCLGGLYLVQGGGRMFVACDAPEVIALIEERLADEAGTGRLPAFERVAIGGVEARRYIARNDTTTRARDCWYELTFDGSRRFRLSARVRRHAKTGYELDSYLFRLRPRTF